MSSTCFQARATAVARKAVRDSIGVIVSAQKSVNDYTDQDHDSKKNNVNTLLSHYERVETVKCI